MNHSPTKFFGFLSSEQKAPGGAFGTAAMPRGFRTSETTTTLADNDKRALDAALVTGRWTTVDHLLFQKKLTLPTREQVFRAAVVDTSSEAVTFFRKLLQVELRLLQLYEGEHKLAVERTLSSTLEEAVKHDNKAVVRIMLGEDSRFNKLVRNEVPSHSRFSDPGALSGLRGFAPYLPFRASNAENRERDLSVEMQAITFAGRYGRGDLAEVILHRLSALGVTLDPFLSEAMQAATSHGYTDFVKSLLRLKPSGSVLGATMVAAARANNDEMAALLKDECTAPDILAAAIGATSNGHFELGQRLCPHQHQRDDLLNEALKAAAKNGSLPGVRALLRLGAQANSANSEALKRAARGAHAAVCSELLAAGAEACAVPLNVLIDLDSGGHTQLVTVLVDGMLKEGREVSYFLKSARGKHSVSVLTHCIERGLDLTVSGEAILRGALESENVQVVKTLEERGVDVKTYATNLLASADSTKQHQIRTLILLAFNTSPTWSQLPENLVDIIERMNQKEILEGLLPLLGRGSCDTTNSNEMYDFLISLSLKNQLRMISPNQTERRLNERFSHHYEALIKKTPAKRQFLNRVTELEVSLRGLDSWISEIADSLLLGIEQARAGASAKDWTTEYIRERRADLRRVIGEFLLNTHGLSDISKLYRLSRVTAKKMPIEARPLLYGDPEWIPLVSEDYQAPNGCSVSCLKNDKELKDAGAALTNCIREPGYVTLSYEGKTSLFKVTAPDGTIIAAFELKPSVTGNIRGTDGSRWMEEQFKGPLNLAPPPEATAARDAFYRALAKREILTNRISSKTGATKESFVEFITGVPIGGSVTIIKNYYKSFGFQSKDGELGLQLIPPGTSLYALVNQ